MPLPKTYNRKKEILQPLLERILDPKIGLPQTFGPFGKAKSRYVAERLRHLFKLIEEEHKKHDVRWVKPKVGFRRSEAFEGWEIVVKQGKDILEGMVF